MSLPGKIEKGRSDWHHGIIAGTMCKFTSCLSPRLRQVGMYKLYMTDSHFSYMLLKPIKNH